MPFLSKLRNKNPDKRHRRVEAHNIVKLCKVFPEKYRSPSDVYFGEIDCVYDIWTDIVIDLTVLGIEGEIEQEDFDKRQSEKKAENTLATQQLKYQNPLRKPEHFDDDW